LGSLTRAYNFTQLALLVYLTLPMYLWYCTGLLYGYKEATGISIAYAWGLWLNFSTINRFSISFFLPLEITLMMLLIVTIAFYSLKIKNFNFTTLPMYAMSGFPLLSKSAVSTSFALHSIDLSHIKVTFPLVELYLSTLIQYP